MKKQIENDLQKIKTVRSILLMKCYIHSNFSKSFFSFFDFLRFKVMWFFFFEQTNKNRLYIFLNRLWFFPSILKVAFWVYYLCSILFFVLLKRIKSKSFSLKPVEIKKYNCSKKIESQTKKFPSLSFLSLLS